MYNNELKEKYIKDMENKGNASIVKYAPGLFKRLMAYEKALNKDASMFNHYEIEDMYKDMNFTKPNTLYNFNSRVKLYTDYLIDNALIEITENH